MFAFCAGMQFRAVTYSTYVSPPPVIIFVAFFLVDIVAELIPFISSSCCSCVVVCSCRFILK